MITIKEVKSKADFKAFVKFPYIIYKDCEYWIPPIISQELEVFDTSKNPVFNDAEATLLLAYKDSKVVGRVAAIINWLEVNKQGDKKMRFGWFDFIDDLDVSNALIKEVIKIGKINNLEFAEGPVGFSNLDKVGVLTEGFDYPNDMITWYNYPYYQKHYEALGFNIEKTYIESSFKFSNVNVESFSKIQDLIKRRYKLTPLNFTKTKDIMPYVDKMFDLFNLSYAKLSSFVEITDIQKEYFKKKYINFINPEYIKFVVDQDNNLIAFAIVMPRFTKALKEINGNLFPIGFLKLLKAKKESKNVNFYLIGVHPDYQNKGVHSIIFNEYYTVFKEKGIIDCYRTPELENNEAIHKIWKNFNPKVIKKRSTYRKAL